MWSLRLALLTVSYLVAFVSSRNVTTGYSPNGPVVFNTGNTTLNVFSDVCQGQPSMIASVNFNGATVRFDFMGTGLTLYGLTDIDRGLYNITIDGGRSQTVSGLSGSRQCSPIYTVTGLSNTQHTFLLTTINQFVLNSMTEMSAKFEFSSFQVTVPDNSTSSTSVNPVSVLPTAISPGSTPRTTSTTRSIPAGSPITTNNIIRGTAPNPTSLSGGAIAGIVVGVTVFVAAVILVPLLIRRHRSRAKYPSYASYTPPPQQQFYSAAAPGSYTGYPEIMSSSPPPRQARYSWRGPLPYDYTPLR